MDKKVIIAIWKYDLFPFYLCGEVTKFCDNGRVETREYGKGTSFIPIKLIWGMYAHTFNSRLQQLKTDERNALRIHDKEWCDKATKLFNDEH